MFSKVIITVCILAGAFGIPVPDEFSQSYNPQPLYPQQSYSVQPQYPPAKYDFNWAVKDDSSGNDFGQTENRDDSNTQGSYYVNLPDGRRQTVTYYVNGDSGYIADVKYDGEARFPEQQQQYQALPQPFYQPQPQLQYPF